MTDADMLGKYRVGGFVSIVSKFAGVSLARMTKSTKKVESCSHIGKDMARSSMYKSSYEEGLLGLRLKGRYI